MAKPFLKWAGGKRQLLGDLFSRLPSTFGENEFRQYAEPFLGGGAVLFEMFNRRKVDSAVVFDSNIDLILCYQVVRDHVRELIGSLDELKTSYHAKTNYEQRKDFYWGLRTAFNKNIGQNNTSWSVEKRVLHATRLIVLNKLCFNGLFRVNRQGIFNVPPSDLTDKAIFSASNLENVSDVLQNVTIIHGDYSVAVEHITSNTFVYFDPPYRPLTKTSFVAYSKSNFTDKEQGDLADLCIELGADVKVMVSNSNPKSVTPSDDFFDRIYPNTAGFFHHPVLANRAINSQGSSRTGTGELIITNYPVPTQSKSSL
jgi:DNA adenine methylase